MKFTSEDLMKVMGLTVGDKIKVNNRNIFKVISETTIQCIETEVCTDIIYIIDQDFEILSKPKRVGELKCEECICAECPLKYIRCENYFYDEVILYDILEGVNSDYKDQELYNLLKARLDKEVVRE